MLALGSARLDLEKRQLCVHGRSFALQTKPFLVLGYLIENRDRMVTREELLGRFWDGHDVYDESLSKAVGIIRKAFGETRNSSKFIETRWRLGYRYIGPFGESSDSGPAPVAEAPHSGTGDASPRNTPDAEIASVQEQPTGVPVSASRSRPSTPAWNGFGRAGYLLLGVLIVFGILATIRFHIRASRIAASVESAPAPISIAVLPFTTNTANEDDQYLGLGLADAVANRLATIPQLHVRSSSTVRFVADSHADPVDMARRLAVQDIVKGDIQARGNELDIRIQLVDGSRGKVLWAGAFAADRANIFPAEDSIVEEVASALLPHFGMAGVKRSSARETSHPEAYSAYMKARYFAIMRTRASLAKAINLLNETIFIDPGYAPAYATLADCYQLQGFYGFVSPSEAYPRAKTAALKALSLDNSLSEAHISLLSVFSDYDWDWNGVTREFKAAVSIDPNYAAAYQYYGFALFGMNRGQEALNAMEHAAQLDPVSPSVRTSLAWAYYLVGQDQQAVDECNGVLDLYPDFVPAHQLLGIVFGQMNADRNAMAELHRALVLEPDARITSVLIAYQTAKSGKRAQAAKELGAILARPDSASIPDYYLAAAWTAIGDKQKAYASLDRGMLSRSNWMIYLHFDRRFDELRADSAFQSLLLRVDSGDRPALLQQAQRLPGK